MFAQLLASMARRGVKSGGMAPPPSSLLFVRHLADSIGTEGEVGVVGGFGPKPPNNRNMS